MASALELWVRENDGDDAVARALFAFSKLRDILRLMQTCRTVCAFGRAMGMHVHLELGIPPGARAAAVRNAVWLPQPAALRAGTAVMRVKARTPLRMQPAVCGGGWGRPVLASSRVAAAFNASMAFGARDGQTFRMTYRLLRRMKDGSLRPVGLAPAPCRATAVRLHEAAATAEAAAVLAGASVAEAARLHGFRWEPAPASIPRMHRRAQVSRIAAVLGDDSSPPPWRPGDETRAWSVPELPALTVCDPAQRYAAPSTWGTFSRLRFVDSDGAPVPCAGDAPLTGRDPRTLIELVLLSDPKLAVSALSNSLPRDADATDRLCIEAQLVFDRFEAPCPFLDYHVQTARYDRCGPYKLVARSSDFQCTATHPDPARARRYDQQNKAAWRARRGGASA